MKTKFLDHIIFSLIVTVAIGHYIVAYAQEDESNVGVIDNRWKLGDVREDYEKYFQLKQKENRQTWRKQLIESTGIAWDLSGAIGMVRGEVDPTVSAAHEFEFDVAGDSAECFRLTVVPLRSDLTDVKVSIGEFRSLTGAHLSIHTLVQTVKGRSDGVWNLAAPSTDDAISRKHKREYVVFASIPQSAVGDEYFGWILLDAKENAGNKPVQLALPLRLRVRGFSLPGRVSYVDKNRLSNATVIHNEHNEFRQLCTMLADKVDSKLSQWAKTEDDRQFVNRCRVLLKKCGSVETTDVNKREDYESLKRELGDKLDRARLVTTCELHNVTIGKNTIPGHTILNSQLYVTHQGEIVVVYPCSVYKSDAVVKSEETFFVLSRDVGLSWEPCKTEDVPGIGYSRAAVLPPDGKTRLEAFSYGWENHPESDRDQLEAKGFYIFDEKEGNTPGVLSVCHRVGMNRSRDGGVTWRTSEIKLPRLMPDLRPHMRGISLHDGVYLYPMYGRYDIKNEKYVSSLVLRTPDGGDTWDIHTIANGMNGYPGAAATGFNETSLVEAPNGDVVAVMRTLDQIELWTAISKDGGKTWSDPRDSGMRGSVPFCVRTSDGYLVCIHGRREKRIFPDGTGMYAGISNDNGKTWRNICLEDCGVQFVDSYAQAVALADGKVFTVYTAPRGLQASCGTLFTPRLLWNSLETSE